MTRPAYATPPVAACGGPPALRTPSCRVTRPVGCPQLAGRGDSEREISAGNARSTAAVRSSWIPASTMYRQWLRWVLSMARPVYDRPTRQKWSPLRNSREPGRACVVAGFYDPNIIDLCQPRAATTRSDFAKLAITGAENRGRRSAWRRRRWRKLICEAGQKRE
jgi:hypothetical protein